MLQSSKLLCFFFFIYVLHLLCGAGFSAVITSVIFAAVSNQLLLWIIHDIQNFLLTQKFALTTYLQILNFLNAVPYTVQKLVIDTHNKCSGIYKIKSTKIHCIWFCSLHWGGIIKHMFKWNITRILQALGHNQKQTPKFKVGNKGLFIHQIAALCFVYEHTSLPCTRS